MNPFQSAREAKEFLISRIVEEAQRENIVLSESERKMLYFSETGWTLPDMATVSAEFDSTYNQSDYEKKIVRLIRNAGKYARKQSPADYDVWWEAIRRLKNEDHYILVMSGRAGLRPRGDLLRLWGTGAALVSVFIAFVFLSIYLSDKYGIDFGRYVPRGALALYIWATVFLAMITYQSLRFFLGAKRVDDWVFRLAQKLVRLVQDKAA
jgi:hypothetical protein